MADWPVEGDCSMARLIEDIRSMATPPKVATPNGHWSSRFRRRVRGYTVYDLIGFVFELAVLCDQLDTPSLVSVEVLGRICLNKLRAQLWTKA